MADYTLADLRGFLLSRYETLKTRLTHRLGSADLAGDALHDTYLRLEGNASDEPIRSPGSYLLRVAMNIAVDQQRRNARLLAESEVENLLDLQDPALGPAETAEVRARVDKLSQVMAQLPPRQRDILLAVRIEHVPQKELAERYGISRRMVERELQRAHAYCMQRLDK